MAVAACLTVGLFLSAMYRLSSPSRGEHFALRAQMKSEVGNTEDRAAVLNNARQLVAVDVAPAAPEARPAAEQADEAPARLQQSRSSGSQSVDGPLAAQDASAQDSIAQARQSFQQEAKQDQKDLSAPINELAVGGVAASEPAVKRPMSGLGVLEKKEAGLDKSRLASNDAESQEQAVLSPFVVAGQADQGSYKSNPTLAGTRVRTDIRDIGSGAVVTSQYLDDVKTSGLGAPGPIENLTVGGRLAKETERLRSEAATGFEETTAAKEPVSTFSLHVGDASFLLAQQALARGVAPDPSSIRPEEFYNAFDYGDPAPAMAEKVSCHTEQSADPFTQQRNLVRIALKVPTTGRAASQPLRLTVLLDTSGSMEREDRAAAVKRALEVLVSLLGRDDRVTLVGFARQPRLLAEQVRGDKAGRLLDIIAHTPAEGGTNLEEAIKLAGELARRHFAPHAQNRIVLLTDGAANLGDAVPEHLAALVEPLRQQGISFDACGVGTDGIDDSVLEALSRKGSGRYYVLDTPESADAGFARQLAGALHPAAENVKVQVRFNPARVGSYRLIGFEQHRLRQEDFHNDKVAAAALAGGEAAVALYEVEALPQGEGDLGEVFVRFRDTAGGAMVERSWPLAYDPDTPSFDRATPTMQLAGTAALLAEKLQGGPRADAIRLAQLAPTVNALRSRYSRDGRVQELAVMFERMRRMHGE
jgi:uncharacterized protein YegL